MNERVKIRFVSFELATKLKQRGFKEYCCGFYTPTDKTEVHRNINPFRGGFAEDSVFSYNSLPSGCLGCDHIDAPTLDQTIDWLISRNISVSATPYVHDNNVIKWKGVVHTVTADAISKGAYAELKDYNSFHDALHGACEVAVTLVLKSSK